MKKTNTKRGPLPGRGPLQTLERGGVDSLGVAPRFRGATLKEVQKQPRKKQTLKRKPS